jgi:hypothetical protein
MMCQCCRVELPPAATTDLCPVCFQGARIATGWKWRCSVHGRTMPWVTS